MICELCKKECDTVDHMGDCHVCAHGLSDCQIPVCVEDCCNADRYSARIAALEEEISRLNAELAVKEEQ